MQIHASNTILSGHLGAKEIRTIKTKETDTEIKRPKYPAGPDGVSN